MGKKILLFAGSARTGSYNRRLVSATAHLVSHHTEAEATAINLADYPAPIYNGDDEAASGLPPGIRQFKQILREHDGLIVSSPEYNGHLPPLLINTLDWASRAEGDEKSSEVFAGKKALVMAASPGRLGGVRVVPRLRAFLSDLGLMVVPGFVTLPGAGQAFDDRGRLTSETTEASVVNLLHRLVAAL